MADYDQWHTSMEVVEAEQSLPIYPWHKTVLKLLPNLDGKRVLEIGCGRGDFALVLGRRYPLATIVGTDFSPAAIALALSKLSPELANVSFRVEDAQNLPFEDGAFDYVISCECLEHVLNPHAMVLSMARCLKVGGEFILTTENYFNGMILAWIKSWLTRQPFNSGSGAQPHENFFVYWRVHGLLHGVGLHVTHMESNHFVWMLLPSFAPDTFFKTDFRHPLLKRIFRPFGRHFTFQGIRWS